MFIDGNKATILITSEVSPEMGEELSYFLYGIQFMEDINEIEVHISSGGGSVIAGYAIFSALRNLVEEGKTVLTIIDGIAASIAGIIWLAGNIRITRDYGLLMIHNPSGGDQKTLDKIKESLKVILSQDFVGNIDEMMNVETWYDADEMKALGLVSEIINTDYELNKNEVNTEKETLYNLYEVCNDILNNETKINKDEMKFKNLIFSKGLKNDFPATEKPEQGTEENPDKEPLNDDDSKEDDSKDDDSTDEMQDMKDRIEALEEMVAKLVDCHNEDEEKTEDEMKDMILNNSGIDKKDFAKWKKFDYKTISNLLNSVKPEKTTVKAPIVSVNSNLDLKEMTQEIFNKTSVEERKLLMKNDMKTYVKFFIKSK